MSVASLFSGGSTEDGVGLTLLATAAINAVADIFKNVRLSIFFMIVILPLFLYLSIQGSLTIDRYHTMLMMKPLTVLNRGQQCVLQEMIARRGIVYVPDVRNIAELCDMNVPEVMELVNATTPAGIEINRRVDEIIQYVPLASNHRQLAYAQNLLEDKLARRVASDLPLSDRDALDILDFARKHTNQPGINVNVQNNTAQLFDFSSMNAEQLEQLIVAIQGAIDTGDIIDAEFTQLATADAPAITARRTDGKD